MPNVFMFIVVIQNVITPSVIRVRTSMLCVVTPSAIKLCQIKLSVAMLSAIMLCVVLLYFFYSKFMDKLNQTGQIKAEFSTLGLGVLAYAMQLHT